MRSHNHKKRRATVKCHARRASFLALILCCNVPLLFDIFVPGHFSVQNCNLYSVEFTSILNVCSNQWFWRTQIWWHQLWSGHLIICELTSAMPHFRCTSLELTCLNILMTKSSQRIQISNHRWNDWRWRLENSATDWRFLSVNAGGKDTIWIF